MFNECNTLSLKMANSSHNELINKYVILIFINQDQLPYFFLVAQVMVNLKIQAHPVLFYVLLIDAKTILGLESFCNTVQQPLLLPGAELGSGFSKP